MDNELIDFIKQFREEARNTYATKVEVMAFREETAINFGKVHVEIGKLETKIAVLETSIIKWFVGTAITIAGVVFAMARYLH